MHMANKHRQRCSRSHITGEVYSKSTGRGRLALGGVTATKETKQWASTGNVKKLDPSGTVVGVENGAGVENSGSSKD